MGQLLVNQPGPGLSRENFYAAECIAYMPTKKAWHVGNALSCIII